MRSFLRAQLLLLVVVAFCGLSASADRELLKKFCKKDGTADLVSIAEVKSLIETIEQGGDQDIKCKDEVKHSILDLKPIIETENICSLESFDRIAEYFALHVQKKILKFQQDKEVRRVPPAVKKFFIAYGMQVSAVCRYSLLEHLARVSSAQITPEDVRFITSWIDDDDVNYRTMVGSEPKLEDLVLLGNIENRFKVKKRNKKGKAQQAEQSEAEAEEKKVSATSVSAENKARMDDMKIRCAQKFKPIYDQLITPVVQLSYLGFSYTDPKLVESYAQFERSADYKEWFKIVFVCDSILKMKVVSIKKDSVPARFLTEDNLERLERENLLDSNDPIASGKQIVSTRPIDSIVLKLAPNQIVLDQANAHLMKAIKNYNPNSGNSGKILVRAAKNMPKLLKSFARTRKIQFGLDDVSGDKLGKSASLRSKFGHTRYRFEVAATNDYRMSKGLKTLMFVGVVGLIVSIILTAANVMTGGLAAAVIAICVASVIAIIIVNSTRSRRVTGY